MSYRFTLATLICTAASFPAYAEPATPEEAARLLGVFQTYLGEVPGFVSVVPTGETYLLTVNADPFAAVAEAEGAKVQISPLALTLTDQGGGLWGVTQDQPFAMEISVPDMLDLSMSFGSMTYAGTYDESLGAFSVGKGEMTNLVVNETVYDAASKAFTVSYTIAEQQYEHSATAGGRGGVDGLFHATSRGMVEVVSLPLAGPGGPLSEIRVEIENVTADMTATGYMPAELLGLVGWLVAHADEETIKADQAGLKAALTAALPVFGNVSGTGEASGVTVATPVGEFSAETLGFRVGMNGVVADGLFGEGISVTGLKLPEGIVPAWATELVPGSFSIDFALSQFDLAKPASMAIEAFDLNRVGDPIDPARGPEFLTALLPESVVGITIAPGHMISPAYKLNFEGAMESGPETKPTGRATISLIGADRITEIVNSGPAEVYTQAGPVMLMARGFSKPGPDGALVWEIDASEPGKVLINGTDMSAMMGMQ